MWRLRNFESINDLEINRAKFSPMSFFWQSQKQLSESSGSISKRCDTGSVAISSPLRRIHRTDFNKGLALSPIPAFRSKFSRIGDLAPQEIMSFQNSHSDYICGVRKQGQICKNSIYCKKHHLCERIKVCRSKPLNELMRSESKNQRVFAKRRELAKSIHSCKSYWANKAYLDDRNETCTHTSCSNSRSGSCQTSPVLTAASEEEEVLGWKATLLKGSYLKRIAKTANVNTKDFLAYLFYRLECYEVLDVDIRVRELETRFDPLYARIL